MEYPKTCVRHLCIGALALLAAGSASAGTITLDFHLDSPTGKPIQDVFIYATAPGESPYLVNFQYQLAASGNHSIQYDLPFAPAETLVTGIYPPASTGNYGVVMLLDTNFALQNVGTKFSALFPIGEQAFIKLATAAHAGDAAALVNLEAFFASPQVAAARFDTGGPMIGVHFTALAIPEPSVNGGILLGLGIVGFGIQRRWFRGAAAGAR